MSVAPLNRESRQQRKADVARRRSAARLPIVGLFGGTTKLTPERSALVHGLGILVAHLGAHLLTASSYSVNEAAADGFASVVGRSGMCIGNVPRGLDGAFDKATYGDGAPIRTVELTIFTSVREIQALAEDPRRQKLNLLTSNAILVLPGSEWIPAELPLPAARDNASAADPVRRRTILVGPAEEFAPELRGHFLHVPAAAAAAVHLRRIIEEQRFVVESAAVA